ncbi:MAG TPA: hypothetical protein VLF90_01775 [Patescibacteria group bacterium]|nr:hypothetical protein [Patescibacteria group bacterium]
MKLNSKIISIIVVLVLVVVGWLIFSSIKDRPLTAKINIEAVPSDLSLTINGNNARQGINKVRPGTYKVVGVRSGFADQSITITVNKGDNKFAGIALLSNSPLTINWYSDHPSDRQKSQDISSRNADITATAATQNVPIIKKLPYLGPGNEFRIDYSFPPGSDPNKPTIVISSSSDGGKQDALAWIKSQGYNTSKLSIVYKGQ